MSPPVSSDVPGERDRARRSAPPSGRRTCIMVLGMHRSGTSALTRVINLLGATLPAEVLGANPTNPTGHWEPLRLIMLHDQMLAEAGSRWDDWRAFDWGELPRRRADYYRAEIARILVEEYGRSALFVLKEPRLSRFVGLYAEIFADLGVDVVYIHTKRNPLAVAHSLEKRDNFSPAYGLLLWLRHELEAEKATRGGRRVFVSYEGLVENWRAMLARVDDNLALEWPRSPNDAAAEIDAFLSAEHRHHTEGEAVLKADPRVPSWVKDAYAAMRALGANPQDSQAELVLDRVGAEFGVPSPVFGQAFYDELTRRQNLLLDAERHWRETAEARAAELANLAAETAQSAAEAAALIEQTQHERAEARQAAQDSAERAIFMRDQHEEQIKLLTDQRDQALAHAIELNALLESHATRFADMEAVLAHERTNADALQVRLSEAESLKGQLDQEKKLTKQLVGERANYEVVATELRRQLADAHQKAAASAKELSAALARNEEKLLEIDADRIRLEDQFGAMVAVLTERTEALEREKNDAEERFLQYESKLSSERERLEFLQADRDRVARELEVAGRDFKEAKHSAAGELEKLRQDLHEAWSTVEAIRRSHSWRATSFIRAISTGIRAAPRRMKSWGWNVAYGTYRRLPLSKHTRQRVRSALFPIIFPADSNIKLAQRIRQVATDHAPQAYLSVMPSLEEDRRFLALHGLVARHVREHGPLTHIFGLPFLGRGGAELVLSNYIRFLNMPVGEAASATSRSILVLTTDRNIVIPESYEAKNVLFVSIFEFFPSSDILQRCRILFRLISLFSPKILHNINSDALWNLIRDHGSRLAQRTDLFASVFALQFDPRTGHRTGYAEFYLQDCLPSLRGVLTDNQRFKDDCHELYCSVPDRSKIKVCYNPARNLQRAQLPANGSGKATKPSVLWAGRLDEEKRVDLLVEIVRRSDDVTFHIFGTNVVDESHDALKEITGRSLHFHGKYDDPVELMQAGPYTAFFFTSRWEGMPNILLEIACLGIPIVAPAVGGVPELIDERTGYLLAEKPAPEDYLKALRSITDNPRQARKRSERLLQLVQKRHSERAFHVAMSEVEGYIR